MGKITKKGWMLLFGIFVFSLLNIFAVDSDINNPLSRLIKENLTNGKSIFDINDEVTDFSFTSYEKIKLIPLEIWDNSYIDKFNWENAVQKDISYVVVDDKIYVQLRAIHFYDLEVYYEHPEFSRTFVNKTFKPDITVSEDSGINMTKPISAKKIGYDKHFEHHKRNTEENIFLLEDKTEEVSGNGVTKNNIISYSFRRVNPHRISETPSYVKQIEMDFSEGEMGVYYYEEEKMGLFGTPEIDIKAGEIFAGAEQEPIIEWEKNFGGYDDEQAHSVQQTSDGGYIVAGEAYFSIFPNDDYNFYLVKTNSAGNKIWEKFFGSSDEEIAYSVRQTSDGGYIIAGETYSSDLDWGKVYIIKTDSNGNKVWEKLYGMGDWNSAYSVRQTSDGNYIVAGDTTYPDEWNTYLLKIDSNGNKIWEKAFDSSDTIDSASSVQQTSDGGYIVAGDKEYLDESSDAYLIKTDSNGNKVWEKTFSKNKNDYADSVDKTSDGGYILAGGTGTISIGTPDLVDVYLIKTDSNGNKQWDKIFGGAKSDTAHSVQQTSDSGYIIAGFTTSFDTYGDAYLIKTDSSGNKQWEKNFGGAYTDGAYSVQQTTDGGYIVVGSTIILPSGQNMYLVKLSFGLAPSCTDGIKNGDETDIDCGGSCSACENGKNCKINFDCLSSYCNLYKICEANCNNGAKDGDETDVDCGGSCPACQNGKNCISNFDCLSKFCSTNNICVIPNCANKIQDGDEQGVDCGGSCLVVCGNCKPYMINGNNDDKIDIVFVPDITYKNNLNLFIQHMGKIINNSYMNSTAIRNNINKFNFYYYTENFSQTNWTACNESFSNFNCKHKIPKSVKKECSFYDSIAIIHTGKQRDFASGIIFSSTYNMSGTFVHESGHAIFGLSDEYCCDSNYYESEPFPNIWGSNKSCRDYAVNNSWNPNDCKLFCDPNITDRGENLCGDGWWRSDPNPDIMRGGGYIVSPFQRADLKNVYWTFDKYPGTTIKSMLDGTEGAGENDKKVIILDLNFKDNKVNLSDITIVYNAAPNYITKSGNINIKLLKNNVTIKDMKIWDPRIIRTEEETFYLRESKVSVAVQVNLSENFINVYNKTTLLLSINLSSYFKDFCEFKDGKCDRDCGKKDIDWPSGDINLDKIINIFDLAAVGLCYGRAATGTCASADLNSDSSINIFDLATVGLNYGRSC